MNFGKVLPTAVPLIVVCVEIVSNVVMCSKPKQNQWILHAFDVLGVLVRVGIWVSEKGVEMLNWCRSRCPEVGLGIVDVVDRCVQRLV